MLVIFLYSTVNLDRLKHFRHFNYLEMSTINPILFSMNRALQLDAVLRSFFMQCKDADCARISVLYLATDELHFHQYQDLIKAHPKVNFFSQENFRKNLLSILSPYARGGSAENIYLLLCAIGRMGFPLGSLSDRIWRRTFEYVQRYLIKSFMPRINENEYVLFLVDDNIFTRTFSLGDAVNVLREQKDLIGFSLRLGENTTYCYMNGRPQILPAFTKINEPVNKFDWTCSDQDFGYPLEVSGSIYRVGDILPYIAGFPFENPNELEDRMAFRAKTFRISHPYLACYQRSVVFCNPINKVQTIIPNRTGERVHYGVKDLTDRFEQGERIRVEAYDGFVSNACHQEVELIFEKIEN